MLAQDAHEGYPRIGILGNNEDDFSSCDSFIGFGSIGSFSASEGRFDTVVGNGSARDGVADVRAWGFILGR